MHIADIHTGRIYGASIGEFEIEWQCEQNQLL